MANKPLSSARTSEVPTPSKIKLSGISRGFRGITDENLVILPSDSEYEFLSPGATIHLEPNVAADGDTHTVQILTEHPYAHSDRRLSRKAKSQSRLDPAETYAVYLLHSAPRRELALEHQEECNAAIRDLLITAGKKNWDGEDAEPVTEDAVNFALKIVRKLPGNVAPPEIFSDPEGNIEFDWHLDNGTMFTISVGRPGDLAISGLRPGKSKLSGMVEDSKGKTSSLLRCGLDWLSEMQE